MYDWIAYPEGMKGVVDFFRKYTRLGTSSRDIFSADTACAFELFLPTPDTIFDSLCLHVEDAGQRAEDFLKEIREITQHMPFFAERKDAKNVYSEVSTYQLGCM